MNHSPIPIAFSSLVLSHCLLYGNSPLKTTCPKVYYKNNSIFKDIQYFPSISRKISIKCILFFRDFNFNPKKSIAISHITVANQTNAATRAGLL